MNSEDPAIKEARSLLQTGQGKKAVAVYERRIHQLGDQQSKSPPLWHAVMNSLLTSLIITAAFITISLWGPDLSNLISPQSTQGWWDDARPIIEAFNGMNEVAGYSPRASLGPVLVEMQRQRQAFRDLDVPSSAREAQSSIENAMTAELDSLFSFARDDPDSLVSEKMEAAEDAWFSAQIELYKLGSDFSLPD